MQIAFVESLAEKIILKLMYQTIRALNNVHFMASVKFLLH